MYTIGQVAKLTGFSPDTLRYYEKIRLLPAADRKPNGLRSYNDNDVELLKFLYCLKQTGLSLDDMGDFIQAGQVFEKEFSKTEENYVSIHKRIDILSKHLEHMEEKRKDIEEVICQTTKKLELYKKLLESKE
ncbi:MerR family transcriptional regulator [Bacillus mojavensis]|uniref:MerR family transcriptional regulator n=1 Tax=Bacillus mojavensis TaxID=72360 RepID=UPI002DBC8AB3|nr:MerR family transcriptional regulator [Bacillus mojavensis]MEC1612304.1 MerR family transcriptional regulator [Bacillus mojavensis]MEC1623758.1 MerR family transcriptional regulator [Bacillus mojavensis]MEC1633419.1 MerR family transcriptional regulator [Bacillus mojavensis]MEC1659375.1 MerR family transcriptional regulator [Bacillus mojavensis]MEC1682644.1 MerR family transcriptional regulator [Bacillus mojavensis]